MADRGSCSADLYRSHPSLSFAFDDSKGWKNCWGGFKCFTPRRREKYLRAESHVVPGPPISVEDPVENESLGLDILNAAPILPPLMCAPPSSPVSFRANMESAPSHLSPATFFTLFPENSERPGSQPESQFDAITADAPVGLFMLDNALVTPPLYSTLTTASATPLSTAPFTPPPELAHLTTPSSPEVPFGQLLGPSSEFKSSLSEKVHEHLSLQSFPLKNLELKYQMYPCSPIGQVGASKSGASSPALSPLPERVGLEEGTSIVNAASHCSVSASGNTSFEGFGSERICDKQVMELVLQQKAVCPQRIQPLTGQSADSADALEQYNTPIVHDSCGYKYLHELQDSIKCCSRCGELSAKCKDLSDALEETQKKLTVVERRVNSIDERERKFKQLMQWMQLGAKLQQESFVQLSKELSWQEAAFLDLQDRNLAEAGISITGSNDA